MLKKIGRSCFEGSGLEQLSLPRGITRLTESAFENCKKLRNITFQEKSELKYIHDRCFCNSGLCEIQTPECLVWIGCAAF